MPSSQSHSFEPAEVSHRCQTWPFGFRGGHQAKMKILKVTPAYPPSAHGGISTHVGLLAVGLAARGNEVRVATTNRYDFKSVMPFSGLHEIERVQVYYARAHWPGRYFFAPRVLQTLRKWVPGSDLIHIHDTRTFLGLAAYLVTRDLPVPYLVTCHGSLSTWVGDRKLKKLHDHLIGRGLAVGASCVIALNRQEMTEIVEYGVPADKVRIIPNTVPLKPTAAGLSERGFKAEN